jgi:hypothetical protein
LPLRVEADQLVNQLFWFYWATRLALGRAEKNFYH